MCRPSRRTLMAMSVSSPIAVPGIVVPKPPQTEQHLSQEGHVRAHRMVDFDVSIRTRVEVTDNQSERGQLPDRPADFPIRRRPASVTRPATQPASGCRSNAATTSCAHPWVGRESSSMKLTTSDEISWSPTFLEFVMFPALAWLSSQRTEGCCSQMSRLESSDDWSTTTISSGGRD